MTEEVIIHRGTTLVRRLSLAPGEAMPWHRDPFHRVTVVLHGTSLAIDYRDGAASQRFEITPGQVDWDEPTERVHRGVNVGDQPYEEVAVFFLDRPDAIAQPRAELCIARPLKRRRGGAYNRARARRHGRIVCQSIKQ